MSFQSLIPMTPKQVYEILSAKPDAVDMDVPLLALWHRSRNYQMSKRKQFLISFKEFKGLVSAWQLKKMAEHYANGTLWDFLRSDAGYVLAPKGRGEFAGDVVDTNTFAFMNRLKARRPHWVKKGEKLTPEHRAAIGNARRGKKHSPEAKQKISAGNKGKTVDAETRVKLSAALIGKKNSEETRRRKREAALARHAAKRASAAVA